MSEGCNPSSGLGVWGGRKCSCLSVGLWVCLSRGDYFFTNKLYPLCIVLVVGPESIFILDKLPCMTRLRSFTDFIEDCTVVHM